MTEAELDQRYMAACAIAREAGDLARRLFDQRQPGTWSLKGAQDYLTEADTQVEALILSRLRTSFPNDAIVAEESGGSPGSHCWLIDPIDGTANFARGLAQWCVSIGFVLDNKPVIGVLDAAKLGDFYAARKGHGATLNGLPMKASTIDKMEEARLEMSWTRRRPLAGYLATLEKVTEAGASFIRMGSGALAMAAVAAGRSDAYVEPHINAWDIAAATVMVEEAGGWVSNFFGEPDCYKKGAPVMAVAPGIAAEMREMTGISS